MDRRWVGLGVVVVLASVGIWAQDVAEDAEDEPVDENTSALQATVGVETTLLAEDLDRYRKLASRRQGILRSLERLYRDLDESLEGREETSTEASRLEDRMEAVERAERERAELVAAQRDLVERIRERRRRIELLELELEAAQGREVVAGGPLSGTWDIVLLPSEQRGTIELRQTGALVNGTYRLGGGWTGSLQGTLVNRKVFLVRIDTRLGRSMEFEGFLSSDGSRIRGTWLNYELAGQEGANGQWSALKR